MHGPRRKPRVGRLQGAKPAPERWDQQARTREFRLAVTALTPPPGLALGLAASCAACAERHPQLDILVRPVHCQMVEATPGNPGPVGEPYRHQLRAKTSRSSPSSRAAGVMIVFWLI